MTKARTKTMKQPLFSLVQEVQEFKEHRGMPFKPKGEHLDMYNVLKIQIHKKSSLKGANHNPMQGRLQVEPCASKEA